MPKVPGLYQAIVRVVVTVTETPAESKEAAIRIMLLELASREDSTTFEDWVNGGMEIKRVTA